MPVVSRSPSGLLRRILPGVAALALVSTFSVTTGCKGLPVKAPYDDGAAPSPDTLLDARAAPLSALRVGRAKIRERSLSANLMYVVQGPERFAGTIQIAGNELVSLAVNEQAYHLRLKSDRAGRPGYHTGPPSACAVERLVGIALAPSDLVALMLGGAPLAVAPADATQVVDQRWNKRWPGREELDLEWSGGRQRLRFAWVGGAWRFAGTTVWTRSGDDFAFAWRVDHEAFHEVDGEVLPETTIIETPAAQGSKKRARERVTLTIKYLEQAPNPADLMPSASNEGGGDDGGWVDTWDDDWGDGDTEASEQADPPEADPSPRPEMASAPAPIPAAFVLDGAGLPARGDLCR